MTTPESAPDQPAQPTPPQSGGSQPAGWGEPPRYGQYAPGYDPSAPQAPGQPQYGTPPAGQYGQTQYGQTQYGQTQYGQQAPGGSLPGYRPAADKPGIVPLRPLTLGELYDGAFGAVRHNPAVALGLTAIVMIVAVIIGTLVSIPLTTWFSDLFGSMVTELEGGTATEDLAGFQDIMGLTYGSSVGTSLLKAFVNPLALGIKAISVTEI